MTEQSQPPKEAAFFTSIRQWGLVRGSNGVVGGVVEGAGDRVGLARVPARLLVVLAWILLPGIVALAYAAGWALLPDRQGNIIIQNFGRGITNVGALIGIGVLTIFGFAAFDGGLFFGIFGMGSSPFPWDRMPYSLFMILVPIAIFFAFAAGVIILIVWLVKRSNNTADAPVTPSGYGTAGLGSEGSGPQQGDNMTDNPNAPQPWEPALLPGDPRTGVPPSAGAVKPAAHTVHTPSASQTAEGAPSPASASAPPPSARPAAPPAPSIPGPGKGGYLAFLAVLLISAAIVTGMDRANVLAVTPVLAWGAAITMGLGAILVIVALLGRKFGFLGFLSAVAVLLALLFAANANQFRYDWRISWDDAWGHEVIQEFEDESFHHPTDLTAMLGENYSAVFVAGACVSPSDWPTWSEVAQLGEPQASMRLDEVATDIEVQASAIHTRFAIPAGASVEIVGAGQTTVVWEARDTSCTMWNDVTYDEYGMAEETDAAPVLSMTNPDTPILTIDAGTDRTIYLEEVAP